MDVMGILTLIINGLIAVGTIGACVISLYIARKNLRNQTEEKCTVEADYAVQTSEHGFITGKKGNVDNSAIQVCVYNSGLRNLYVQSISIGYLGKFILIPKNLYTNCPNDQEVVSGYRVPFHILLSDLKSNPKIMKVYNRDHCCPAKEQEKSPKSQRDVVQRLKTNNRHTRRFWT